MDQTSHDPKKLSSSECDEHDPFIQQKTKEIREHHGFNLGKYVVSSVLL